MLKKVLASISYRIRKINTTIKCFWILMKQILFSFALFMSTTAARRDVLSSYKFVPSNQVESAVDPDWPAAAVVSNTECIL